MRYAIRLAVACFLAFASLATASAEKRVALVIGNADYKIGPLANPVNDATAVAEALEKQLKFDTVLLRKNLTLDGFRAALREMASESVGAELGVIYFAGHGIEVGGRNFLIPVDAALRAARDIELEAVALDIVLGQLDGVRKLRLVILDACRNNPFAVSGAKRSVMRGLARYEPEGNTLIAYAAKDGTTADDGKGPHSPFTKALLKRIATPGLDIRRVFGYVSEDVKAATNRLQEPYLYGQLGGAEIALVPAAVKTAPTVLPPPPPPFPAPPPADGLSAADAARVCRDVEAMSSLPLLGVLAGQHKGTAAGPCIAARMDELKAAEAGKKAAAEKAKADAEKKVSMQAPLPGPEATSVPVTECDRLAASPGFGPAGVQGVASALVDATRAVPACRVAVAQYPAETRLQAWLGRSLHKAGLHDEARRWYEQAAEKGHPVALTNLGALYASGLGVPHDYAKARSWYEKAAEQGEPAAIFNLGMLYRDGKGVAQDYANARSWFEKAAERGHGGGLNELGRLYYSGLGVPQSYVTARGWYEKAAEKGEPAGMVNLGVLYHDGKGVPQDYANARSWFEKAAAKGNATAMFNLAAMLQAGRGVARSPQAAARYLLAAARAGAMQARRSLDDEMMRTWTPDVRRAVQELLAASGDYRGRIDGVWNEASRNAARAYYSRRS